MLAAFVGGLAAIVTLTTLGARDKPASAAGAGDWSVVERAGSALLSGDRCAKCHNASTGVAAPIETGHIRQPGDWIASHVADPEMIAAGLRPAPTTNGRDTKAILAALARLRSEAPPVMDAATAQATVLFNRNCSSCHRIGGVGGDEGPKLDAVGSKFDAAMMSRRIVNPLSVESNAQMPAFGTKLTPDEIAAISAWLAAHK